MHAARRGRWPCQSLNCVAPGRGDLSLSRFHPAPFESLWFPDHVQYTATRPEGWSLWPGPWRVIPKALGHEVLCNRFRTRASAKMAPPEGLSAPSGPRHRRRGRGGVPGVRCLPIDGRIGPAGGSPRADPRDGTQAPRTTRGKHYQVDGRTATSAQPVHRSWWVGTRTLLLRVVAAPDWWNYRSRVRTIRRAGALKSHCGRGARLREIHQVVRVGSYRRERRSSSDQAAGHTPLANSVIGHQTRLPKTVASWRGARRDGQLCRRAASGGTWLSRDLLPRLREA